MKIKGFPNYRFIKDEVYDLRGKKKNILIGTRGKSFYKLKNYNGKWSSISLAKLKALAGNIMSIPKDAVPIPGYNNYYIDKLATIYSFNRFDPTGIIIKQTQTQNGYIVAGIQGKSLEVHMLMAKAFIMVNYIERGLCVLHLDNDKTNNNLNNLVVGTYSRNNKQAYKDGLNPGNGLKKLL